MARPPKEITPEISKRICDGIRAGAAAEVAAQAAGISPRLYYKWKAKGEAGTSSVFVQFVQDIKRAAAQEELAGLAEIYAASQRQVVKRETVTTQNLDGTTTTTTKETFAPGQWTARAWIMERRHRERWGRNVTVDIPRLDADAAAARRERIEALKRLTPEERDELRRLRDKVNGVNVTPSQGS